MVNWFLRRVSEQFNEETIVFSTNSAGTTGQPHVDVVGHLPYII